MPKRTCTLPNCEKPHRARGLCAMHWKREYGKRTRYPITCQTCGVEWMSARPDGRYCSDECKGHAYRTRAVCDLSRQHPVMLLINPPKPKRRPQPQRVAECEWCEAPFTTIKPAQRMCSTRCKMKAKQCRRRGRAAGSTSHYNWAGVMRLFLAFDRRCAYCEQPIPGQPDPDHVVPLSKGGSNSLANILPCCRLCNSDKRDLNLIEWAASRQARGLPPVRVDVDRFTHLAISSAA